MSRIWIVVCATMCCVKRCDMNQLQDARVHADRHTFSFIIIVALCNCRLPAVGMLQGKGSSCSRLHHNSTPMLSSPMQARKRLEELRVLIGQGRSSAAATPACSHFLRAQSCAGAGAGHWRPWRPACRPLTPACRVPCMHFGAQEPCAGGGSAQGAELTPACQVSVHAPWCSRAVSAGDGAAQGAGLNPACWVPVHAPWR